MIEKKITIKHKNGLHMRPAMYLVEISSDFKSKVTIIDKDGTIADATSIMEVLMIGATVGEAITIVAERKDEKKAIKAIEKLIKSDFENLIKAEG